MESLIYRLAHERATRSDLQWLAQLVSGLILAAVRYVGDLIRRRKASQIKNDLASEEHSGVPKTASASDVHPQLSY
jgi:hypothetical protein